MKALLLSLVIVSLAATGAYAADCNTKANITSPMNNNSIYTDAPVFVKSVPNGELYTLGDAESMVDVLHLYGSDGYEFGYAAGQLLGPKVNDTMTNAWNYFEAQILQAINGTKIPAKYNLPSWLVKRIATIGLKAALDLQNLESEAFINPEIYKEMKGLSDATGVDYHEIVRIHLIGEITRGSCSFYGAYGEATLNSKVLQLRALDWDIHAGLQNHPTVTIYHPKNTTTMGHPFANVGWAGWVGTLTGMSSSQIGISEIGISYPDKKWFGTETFIGIPFIFLERKIVQYGTSVYDAMNMIKNANRTCDLVLGVADGVHNTARMVAYSGSEAFIFNDTDLQPNEWWHPRINDTVYCGMDWICPYYQHLLSVQLQKFHGTLTPELSISSVTAVVGTGDLHAAVMDLTDQVLYVANARGKTQTGPQLAYQRRFNKLPMRSTFTKKYGEGRTSPVAQQLAILPELHVANEKKN